MGNEIKHKERKYMHMRYERKDTYPIERILPLIYEPPKGMNARKCRVTLNGDSVCIASLRLLTFKFKGLSCPCGLTGTFFAKERDYVSAKQNGRYHLNLYAIDENGEEVLMTKDHILAYANGGLSVLENMQTMCKPCNEKKGKEII